MMKVVVGRTVLKTVSALSTSSRYMNHPTSSKPTPNKNPAAA